jgi:uncharacterized protein YbaR (Trm112 family)
MCLDFLYNFCLKHLILRRTERDIIKTRIGLHINYPYSCQILIKLEFIDRFSKITQIYNFMTIRPVIAELFHADGRTDCRKDRHDEAKSRFSQFCERAKLIYCIDKDSIPYLLRTQYANIRKASWLMICRNHTC